MEERKEPQGAGVPVTERARIAGVEAGVAAGLLPATLDEARPGSETLTGGWEPVEVAEGEEARVEGAETTALRDSNAAVQLPVPVPPEVPYDLPDWTDPPTLQIPRVLRDLDREGEPGGRLPSAPGGPVWRERQEDWDDTDAILGDLASAGLHVTAYEESSSDDPFAYDFLDLDDDASWGAAPERLGSAETVASTEAPDTTSAADRPVGDAVGEQAGPPPATDLVGPDEEVSARIARRHRRHTTPRARPARPLRPQRAAADPKVSAGVALGEQTGGAPAATAPTAVSRPPDDHPVPQGLGARSAPARNPVVATLTGLALAAVLLATFFAGPPAVLVVVTLAVTLAVAELFNSLRLAGYRPATLIALVGAPAMMVAAYFRGPDAITIGFVAYVVLAMIWYLVGVTRRSPVANLAVSVLGFAWPGVLGAFAGLLLNTRIFPDRHGIAFMLGAIIAAVGYDVGGYAVGSRLGRHKLVPAISPNKTWEGLIGGCVVAVAASAGIVSQIHPWKLSTAVVLGLIVAVVAPIGDLVESMIKRDLGVKDMGSLLPGHGGMLDRIDALLFVMPATYCFVRLAHVG